MKQADEIRQYADDHYVKPARERGERQVSIRAGTVRQEMRLSSDSVAAVGGALDTDVFERFANVKQLKEKYHGVDSRRGANANFVFEILPLSDYRARDDYVGNWRERAFELSPSEFQELVREYLEAKGFSDAEVEIVIKMKV